MSDKKKKQSFDLLCRLALVASSIFLFVLSMPGRDFPALIWVALVPLYLALKGSSPFKASGLMFLHMLISFLFAIWWFSYALIDFTQSSLAVSMSILVLFCLALAFPYAIAGFLIGKYAHMGKVSAAVFAAASISLVISFIPNALPGNYAHSLYQQTPMIQVLDFGGVPALVFIVLLVNFLLALALTSLSKSTKTAFVLFACAGLLFSINYLYGTHRLEAQRIALQGQPSLRVGVVQPMLQREDSLDTLYSLSKRLVQENPNIDLLVWPEFPARFSYADSRSDRRKVNQLISELSLPMVLVSGYNYAPGVNKNDPNASYRNTAHHIDAGRRLKASYSKQLLVPFFEYLPFESSAALMREIFPGVLRYIPGQKKQLFELNEQFKVAPLICYETIFSEFTRGFIDLGANFILNLSNDIWQGDSHGSEYHMALGMMRSVEFRVPWLRATNSGISAVVSSSGEIDMETVTQGMSRDMQVYELQTPKERSFYSRQPHAFSIALLLLITALAIRRRKVKPV